MRSSACVELASLHRVDLAETNAEEMTNVPRKTITGEDEGTDQTSCSCFESKHGLCASSMAHGMAMLVHHSGPD